MRWPSNASKTTKIIPHKSREKIPPKTRGGKGLDPKVDHTVWSMITTYNRKKKIDIDKTLIFQFDEIVLEVLIKTTQMQTFKSKYYHNQKPHLINWVNYFQKIHGFNP